MVNKNHISCYDFRIWNTKHKTHLSVSPIEFGQHCFHNSEQWLTSQISKIPRISFAKKRPSIYGDYVTLSKWMCPHTRYDFSMNMITKRNRTAGGISKIADILIQKLKWWTHFISTFKRIKLDMSKMCTLVSRYTSRKEDIVISILL